MTTGVIRMMVTYHFQSWKLCYIARHHLLLQSIASDLRNQNLLVVLSTAQLLNITRLGCPELADISLPAISCTFAWHKPKNVCELRTAYSLAQCLKFYTLGMQFAKCRPQPAFHWCFPDVVVTSTYILSQRARKKVRHHLPEWWPQTASEDWNLFRYAVLYETQWFILVTFKSHIPKDEVHELGDSRHTLSVYCGQYIRITSENSQVYLSKKNWSRLMDLASACIDRKVIKFNRPQDKLVEWRNKYFESKSFLHLQKQMPLISKFVWWTRLQSKYFQQVLYRWLNVYIVYILMSVKVKWIIRFVRPLIKLYF